MSNAPRFAILMSTYNGEKFLAEQIDSILAQEAVTVHLFIRDDGSVDNTVNVARKYYDIWPGLGSLDRGENLRPAASFLKLLEDAPDTFDYYAFCDQDDVWFPEKLKFAAEMLSGFPENRPGLYCARAVCTDRDLKPLGHTTHRGSGRFEESMFANVVAGHSLVMNKAAAMLVRSRRPGPAMIMHDWWCALVVSAFGAIVCDQRQTLYYRQHQGNVQGTVPGRIPMLLVQLRAFLRDPRSFYPIHAQVTELLRLYGDRIGPSEKKAAEALVRSRRSLGSRLAYALFARIPRWDLWGAVGTRALIAVGWY